MAHDPSRTEQATPKRRQKARKEGQVARSVDVGSTAVLLATLAALAVAAPRMLASAEAIVRTGLARSGSPGVLGHDGAGLGSLLRWALVSFAATVAPVLVVGALAALLAGVGQVGFTFSAKGLRPSFARLNPAAGLKRMFGPRQWFELGKSLAKLAVVGGAGASAVWSQRTGLGGLVGMPPDLLLGKVGATVTAIALRAGAALAAVAVLDYVWQRRQLARSLRMTKDEVRRETRENDLSPEVRAHIRRRQLESARRRMLAEVPTADVVVVNPTHYAVALRYDGSRLAPEVVAKGIDHLAMTIREAAKEAGVAVVHAPPLARALYREVELGQVIPEEFFHAVAEVLAFVFRTVGRRRRMGGVA